MTATFVATNPHAGTVVSSAPTRSWTQTLLPPFTLKGGADVAYGAGSSVTYSRDLTGGRGALDGAIGGAAIMYAGVEGTIPMFNSTPGRPSFSVGTTVAAGVGVGLSIDFEIREQPLIRIGGGTLSIRYPVPTAIKPFLGIGAGGSYKVEAPGPSTTLIEVKVDNDGNKTSGGILRGK